MLYTTYFAGIVPANAGQVVKRLLEINGITFENNLQDLPNEDEHEESFRIRRKKRRYI